jgi:uncharacterized protein YjiS (DUF1127 family)
MALMDVSTQDGLSWALAPLAGWPEAARQSRPLSTFKHMAARFLTWRARRETVRLLNAVDPATLRDLGITDVESAVYGAPEGRKRRYDPDWWRKGRRG